MARKTIKGLEEIIEDLEKCLNAQNKINVELDNQISQMQMIDDDKFENSPIYHQMVKEIEQLRAIIRLNEINIKSKEDTIKKNRDTIQKLLKENEELKSNNYVNKLKNERGAGRKEMFTEEQKARVKMLRLQGKSYRAIAKDMNCSVATVHKIINEQQC
ncbi:helix-turn-helix domain-containing protein [Clostridium saudiense]|uniref:helix-turn-helix domain-containing protein n=1 Tax=Clostridium saudiense TaxID=1414720 RepID=UPI0032424739